MTKLNIQVINNAKHALNNHPLLVGGVMQTFEDVRTFMEYHVFAVWDFMCLAKSLQHHIVPSGDVWIPKSSEVTQAGRMINEIVLGEETDIDPTTGGFISHFDLYLRAMKEVGANTDAAERFVQQLRTTKTRSINSLLMDVPTASETFVHTTLNFVATGKPHVIAAAFAFGRETVIPDMFTALIKNSTVDLSAMPSFKYYLERHIEVDGEDHGPAALNLVELLCDGDPVKIDEAQTAALEAISHRTAFWTRIQSVIEQIQAIKR